MFGLPGSPLFESFQFPEALCQMIMVLPEEKSLAGGCGTGQAICYG